MYGVAKMKNVMMKKEKVLILICFGVIFFSCGIPVTSYGEENEDKNKEISSTTIEENSELFEKKNISDEIIFETNETNFITTKGYTILSTPYVNESNNFSGLTVQVYKQSGELNGGYGIVFCRSKIESKDFMLCVLIDTKGFFTVGKVYDGKFTQIKNWTKSNYLRTGYGIKNLIKVTFNKENNNFQLYFNGSLAYNFKVEENISFKDSKAGYVVVISDTEKFPVIPVKVIFEKM